MLNKYYAKNRLIPHPTQSRYKDYLLTFGFSVCVFCFLLVYNFSDIPYDARIYYNLSQSLGSSGHFSLTTFPAHYRGIIFPLLLYPFNLLAKTIGGNLLLGYWLLASLFLGLFTLCFPALFNFSNNTTISLIPAILTFLIFRGLFFTTLSDFIATAFLVFALALINKGYSIEIQTNSFLQCGLFYLGGVCAYAAYNIRTIYLFCFPIMLLYPYINRQIGLQKNLLFCFAVALGIFSVGCIQAFSNLNNFGIFSLAVQSEYMNQPLFLFQLISGLEVSFYETWTGGGAGIPPGYRYYDLVGNQILAATKITRESSYLQYFSLFFKYPFEMLSVYFRHFLVMLNPMAGSAYVYARNGRFSFTLLNYSMLYISITYFMQNFFFISGTQLKSKIAVLSKDAKNSVISLIVLFMPFAAIIPGAVEERFALPFWLIIFGMLSYVVNWKSMLNGFKLKPVRTIITYIAGLILFTAILTSIYATNPEQALLPIFGR